MVQNLKRILYILHDIHNYNESFLTDLSLITTLHTTCWRQSVTDVLHVTCTRFLFRHVSVRFRD